MKERKLDDLLRNCLDTKIPLVLLVSGLIGTDYVTYFNDANPILIIPSAFSLVLGISCYGIHEYTRDQNKNEDYNSNTSQY